MLPSIAASPSNYKKVRTSKGTSPLMIVRQMMTEKENWIAVTKKANISILVSTCLKGFNVFIKYMITKL